MRQSCWVATRHRRGRASSTHTARRGAGSATAEVLENGAGGVLCVAPGRDRQRCVPAETPGEHRMDLRPEPIRPTPRRYARWRRCSPSSGRSRPPIRPAARARGRGHVGRGGPSRDCVLVLRAMDRRHRWGAVGAALVAAVAIDLDHLPQLLGWTRGLPTGHPCPVAAGGDARLGGPAAATATLLVGIAMASPSTCCAMRRRAACRVVARRAPAHRHDPVWGDGAAFARW